MEPELFEEIEKVKRLAERKPQLIEALLAERAKINENLTALGYEPPKKARKPRTPKPEGEETPKRRSRKTA